MKMKNIKWVLAAFAMVLPLILTACHRTQTPEEPNRAKTEDYVVVTGVVSSIRYSADGTALYFGVEEANPECEDSTFKIVGANLTIVKENGIDEKIRVGDRISFMTTTEYFIDDDALPIVGLSVGSDTLLEFSDGYGNFLSWLRE